MGRREDGTKDNSFKNFSYMGNEEKCSNSQQIWNEEPAYYFLTREPKITAGGKPYQGKKG